MIHLTEKALFKIKEVIKSENIPEDQGLRLLIRGGGCSGFINELFFDQKKEFDREFLFGDEVKVFIDEMSLMYMSGTELDYEDTLISSGFKFKNPNAKSTCGCEKSFSM